MPTDQLPENAIASSNTNGDVLTTVAGRTVWAAPSGGGGFNPGAGRSPRLVPYGVKIRGANIGAKQYGDAGDKPWARMFAEWDVLWDTYIKPQIDAAASVGANAIRMMGAAPGVLAGLCTETQYLDGYERLVDYCATQGLYVYGCLSASQEWHGQSVAAVMPVMEAQAQMLDGKPNVIGIDVCQELSMGGAFIPFTSLHDAADQLVTPVRSVTTLPLTCSGVTNNNSSSAQFAATTVTDYDDLFDFFDYHPYYDGMTVAHVQTAADAAAAVDKVILFGEYGATSTNYQRYEAVAAASAAISNLVGSFQWQVADRLADSGTDFGMFTETFVPRSALITAFQMIPDHEGARHPGHILLDEATLLPARGRIKFTGAGVAATDDGAADTTTVTVPGIALAVKDEGSTVDSAPVSLNFVGTHVTATTDGSGNVSVTVAASVGGELLMQDGVTSPPVPLETEAGDDWLYQD